MDRWITLQNRMKEKTWAKEEKVSNNKSDLPF